MNRKFEPISHGYRVKNCVSLLKHELMTAQPLKSLRRIIGTTFIDRNCCHKMVTKVVFTFGTSQVYHPLVDTITSQTYMNFK